MFCIDLPFHGETIWNETDAFMPSDLLNIIQRITNFSNQKISLLGYSLGGRVALQLIELIPQEIAQVFLLAPDGLHKNFWYYLSTQTKFGNRLSRKAVDTPQAVFYMLRAAKKLKLMDENIINMAHYYLDDKFNRKLLYERWITMRKFRPDLSLVKKEIIKNKLDVRVIFGKYDYVILSKRSSFLRKNNPTVKIKIIDAGHRLLEEKYLPAIVDFFSR